MRSSTLLAIAVVAASLNACAPLPQRLRGDFAALEPNQTSAGELNGYPVRWGGIVTGERMVDAGACIEVAIFPLDKWTQRPIGLTGTKAYHHVAVTRPAYFISGKLRPAPRFLACGDQILDGTTFYPGAVVTATGIVEP